VSFGGVPVKWSGPRALALLFAAAGAVALFDSVSLAVQEQARTNDGRVVSGVVTSRYRIEGMVTAWVVDYRFPCRAYRGGCSGRDFVSDELWSRLRTGAAVNVRQAEGETTTARLDANPQIGTALAKTALACLLFVVACVTSGHLRLRRAKNPTDVVATA
jgi:hypothetical protein